MSLSCSVIAEGKIKKISPRISTKSRITSSLSSTRGESESKICKVRGHLAVPQQDFLDGQTILVHELRILEYKNLNSQVSEARVPDLTEHERFSMSLRLIVFKSHF